MSTAKKETIGGTLLVAFVGCVVLVAALATRRQKKLSV